MLDLRVGEHLIDGIDRSAWHAGLVEALDPFGAGASGRINIDLGIERIAILGTRCGVLVFRLLQQRGRVRGFAEPLPDPLPGGGDVDVAVFSLEYAGRNAGRMIVAGLLRHLTAHEITGGLEIEHENLRLQQRRLDVLALLGFLAFEQRDQNAEGGEHAGGEVGDRDADAHRSLTRQAGDRHQPAHALRDLIEARPIGIGPVLAEAGNAGVNDARIDLGERLVVDTEPLLHVGPEILHHDVGLPDHALEGGEPVGHLQIKRHAAFVAMQVLKIGPLARPAHWLFHSGRRFDLDDIGAPVGELAHAGRSRPYAGEIEHRESRKSFGSAGNRHRWDLRHNSKEGPELPRSHRRCLPAWPGRDRSFALCGFARMPPPTAIFPALSGGDHE